MIVPHISTLRYRPRSFCPSVPSVWNDLPHKLIDNDIHRIKFKAGLKASVFVHKYYNDMIVLRSSTSHYGPRSFHSSLSPVWNDIIIIIMIIIKLFV